MNRIPNDNEKNPFNSSVKQALLDLEKVATASANPEDLKALKAIKSLLKVTNNKLLGEADKVFNQHRYNNKKLHFCKIKNYKEQQIVFSLTDKECKLLLYMLTFMSQSNAIAIKQSDLAKDLKSSKRDISKALQSLETGGYITKVTMDKNLGTIYMVNPAVATVGKQDCFKLFEKITPVTSFNKFYDVNKLVADVAAVEISFVDSDTTTNTIRTNLKITKK